MLMTPEVIVDNKFIKLLNYINNELQERYGLRRVPISIDVEKYDLDEVSCDILDEKLGRVGWKIYGIGGDYNYIIIGEKEE